jgi:hypothetical protein
VFPSLCACTNTEEVDNHLVTREQSLRRVAPSPFIFHLLWAQRVGEQASEIAVHRATLARVCGRLGLWGAYSWLLAPSARPMLIWFFVVDTIRGTTLCTSAYTNCVWLYRTYTRDISCEWNTDALSTVPSRGTLCSSYLCMFYFRLLLMWVVIQTCTYMSSHTSHWFFGIIKTDNA